MEENTEVVLGETNEDIPLVPDDWAMPKPYHMTITLADGTVLNGHARRILDGLWIFMDESSDLGYMELVQIFVNPEKTSQIYNHVSADETITYTGYTRLTSINADDNGKFIISLTRPIE